MLDDKLKKVQLVHGGGGLAMDEFIKKIFYKFFGNEILNESEDAALLKLNQRDLAFTTDGFTIDPILFPGGDIGRLAVCGTVNDLLMRGAKPLYLSCSFIIEEGFDIDLLVEIVKSMGKTCKEANVKIVAGDTKVIEKGKADKVFIITSGIGEVSPGVDISISNARPGDKIILSGTIGDHEMAILSVRGRFEFEPPILSDCAPLVKIVNNRLKYKNAIKVLRDPTRGGVSEVLYNISESSKVGIEIFEESLPVKQQVYSVCNMLGLESLHLANEGKLVAVVDYTYAEEILDLIKTSPYGENARIIGTVNDSGLVTMKTAYKTSRIIDRFIGEQLPRIC